VAQVRYWEFEQGEALAPGESRWVYLGSWEEYRKGALSITAIPYQGSGGWEDVLKVDNVNVTRTQDNIGSSGLSQIDFYAGCNVTNNGQTTVTVWSVVVGVIGP